MPLHGLSKVVSSRQHVPTAKTYNASIAAIAQVLPSCVTYQATLKERTLVTAIAASSLNCYSFVHFLALLQFWLSF
eukprot:3452161-Amphidinium_carterae.1